MNAQTQNQKVKAVFERLIAYLSPVQEVKSNQNYWSEYDHKKHTYTVIKARCNFLNAKNIPLPVTDILVEVTESNICILGENLEYNIAPDQILTIWNRLKSLKN